MGFQPQWNVVDH